MKPGSMSTRGSGMAWPPQAESHGQGGSKPDQEHLAEAVLRDSTVQPIRFHDSPLVIFPSVECPAGVQAKRAGCRFTVSEPLNPDKVAVISAVDRAARLQGGAPGKYLLAVTRPPPVLSRQQVAHGAAAG
jgi:hypothetical protein